VRGTETGTEVERRGGEQARRCQAGSLKPLQDLTVAGKLSEPASALLFISPGYSIIANIGRQVTTSMTRGRSIMVV